MTGPQVVFAAAALAAAGVAAAAFSAAPRADSADARWVVAVLPGAGGGAFVTDGATGETMFCTPSACRRLPVGAAPGAAAPLPAAPPRPATLDRILRDAPPGAAPPPPPAPGRVDPAFENF